MKKISIELSHKTVPVVIGGPISKFASALASSAPARKILAVTNPSIRRMYGARLAKSVRAAGIELVWAEIPSGEKHKNLRSLERIYSRAVEAGLDRDSVIAALGGGVVGDMAGFAAATLFRGIRYVQVPTTLLAMVDSSVGGKVGVDLKEGKNLAGAFWQPELVYVSREFLKTLPPREIANGLGEIVKYAVISDRKLFEYLEKSTLPDFRWDFVIERCIRAKAAVVAKDERETKGVREILNFGHTYAHALEKAASYRAVSHGEAVSIGVLKESVLAERLCGFKAARRVRNLLSALGLPTEAPKSVSRSALAAAVLRDKKIRGERIRLYLPSSIGRAVFMEAPVDDVRSALAAF